MVFFLQETETACWIYKQCILAWSFLNLFELFFLCSKTSTTWTKRSLVWVLLCNDPRYGLTHRAALCVMDTWRKLWRRMEVVQKQDWFCGPKTPLLLPFCMIYWVIHCPAWTKWVTGQYVNIHYVKLHRLLQLITIRSIRNQIYGIAGIQVSVTPAAKLLTGHWCPVNCEELKMFACNYMFTLIFLEFPADHKSLLGQSTKTLVLIQRQQQMILQMNICGSYWAGFPINCKCRRPHVKRAGDSQLTKQKGTGEMKKQLKILHSATVGALLCSRVLL